MAAATLSESTPAAHRDRPPVRRCAAIAAAVRPAPSAPMQQRGAGPLRGGQALDRHRVRRGRQGQHGEAGRLDLGQPGGPGLQPGVRHGEDLAHADPDAAPVERVGAGRARAARRRRRAPPRARKIAPRLVWLLTSSRITTRRAAASTSAAVGSGLRWKEASTPAVDVEAGRLLQHLRGGGVDRGVAGVQVAELVDPLGVDQERAGRVAGPQRAAQHQLPLGDEQPVRRLPAGPQLDVGQRPVVGDPLVVGVGDLFHGHPPILPVAGGASRTAHRARRAPHLPIAPGGSRAFTRRAVPRG